MRAAPRGTKGRQMAKKIERGARTQVGAHAEPFQRHETKYADESREADGRARCTCRRRSPESCRRPGSSARTGRLSSASERAAFALARGRIDGQIQPAHQYREQHEIGHESEHHHGAAGGRRHVDFIDGHRHREQRIHPADLQPQLRDAAAVASRADSAHAIRALAGLRIRAVGDQQHRRRRRRGEARGRIPRGTISTTGAVPPRTAARASFSDSAAVVSLTPCDFEIARRSGRVLAARDRELERLVRLDARSD